MSLVLLTYSSIRRLDSTICRGIGRKRKYTYSGEFVHYGEFTFPFPRRALTDLITSCLHYYEQPRPPPRSTHVSGPNTCILKCKKGGEGGAHPSMLPLQSTMYVSHIVE